MNSVDQRKYDKSNLTAITNPKSQIMDILEKVMAQPLTCPQVVTEVAAPKRVVRDADTHTRLHDCEYELTQTIKESARLRMALATKTAENQQLRLQLQRQRQQIQQLLTTLQQKNRFQASRSARQVSLPLVTQGESAQLFRVHPLNAETTPSTKIGVELAAVAVAKRFCADVFEIDAQEQFLQPAMAGANQTNNPRIDLPHLPRHQDPRI